MPEWIYSVIAVVAVTGIVMVFVNKRKSEEWEGELFKKKLNPGDMDTSETYSLVFKTSEGKKKRYQVTNKVFGDWNEGDKAKKVKGSFMPERVE